MVTINVSEETKEEFKKIKLELSAKQGKSISEDELLKILIEKYKEKK
jgi:isopropylmalate/homocitrate/citramalate synthase